MKVAIFEEFGGPIRIDSFPDPVPEKDGVVIKVMANGICRSDWHGWMGHDSDITLPHVPGHELAGIVEAVGKDVTRWKPDDRVTLPFACGCGKCTQCKQGNQHICDDYFQPGFTSWGSFANRVAIRYADVNLVRLPDEMDFADAASLGCRFITSFRAVVAQGRVTAGEWVAVHGCGGIGLSALMIASAIGARVICVDINPETLQFAKTLGAYSVLNANEETDIPGAIKEMTQGGAHVSLDALGNNETCLNSIRCLRKRGRHIQIGVMAAEHKETPIPMGMVMFNEIELIGSHGMQAHAYAPMLRMILDGRLIPRKLISQCVSLEEGVSMMRQMGTSPPTGVVVIDQFD